MRAKKLPLRTSSPAARLLAGGLVKAATAFKELKPQTLQKMAYLLGKAAVDNAPTVRKS